MITLYSMPNTRAGRVRWTLEELSLPYREVSLDRAAGEHKQAAFLAINPMGRVPALVDDGLVVTESPAICLHLADRDPAKGLAPRAGPERSRLMQWLFLATNEMEAPLTTAFVLTVRVPSAERLPAVVPWCRSRFAEASCVLDRHLRGHATLLASGFSVGDVFMTCVLSWAHFDGLLGAFPRLEAYRQAHLARPAARRAFAADEPN